MFCPACGAKNSIEQKFCRSCGLNLEQSAQSLVAQQPSGKLTASGVAERRLEKLGTIAFGGLGVAGLLGVLGLIYTIFVKFILSGSSVMSGVIFILLLIFAVLGLAYVIFNESLKEKRLAARDQSVEPSLEEADTPRLLDANELDHPVPASVTEDTTALLEAKRKTRDLT